MQDITLDSSVTADYIQHGFDDPIELILFLASQNREERLFKEDYKVSLPYPNEGDYNTKLLLTPRNIEKIGSVRIYYNRLDFRYLQAREDFESNIDFTTVTSGRELIEKINSYYFIRISSNDYIDTPIDPGTAFRLYANPLSYLFVGEFRSGSLAKVLSLVGPSEVNEGDTAVYTVTLSDTEEGASFSTNIYGTVDTEDYILPMVLSNGVTFTNNKLRIPNNVTEFTIGIKTIEDNLGEGNEELTIKVSNKTATTTIIDTSIGVPSIISINGPTSINESEILRLEVQVKNNRLTTRSFNCPIIYSGNVNNDDYGPISYTDGVSSTNDILHIPGGVYRFYIDIPIKADNRTEGSEILITTVDTKSHTTLINDTSVEIVVIINTVTCQPTVEEGSVLTVLVTTKNNLPGSGGYRGIFSISSNVNNLDYSNITASDFVTITDDTITIPQGVSSFSINIPIVADLLTEGEETIIVSVGDKSCSSRILDTSLTPPHVTSIVSVGSVNAGDSVWFTVNLSHNIDEYRPIFTLDGTAVAGADYLNNWTVNSDVVINGNTFVIPANLRSFDVLVSTKINKWWLDNDNVSLRLTVSDKSSTTNISYIAPPKMYYVSSLYPVIEEADGVTVSVPELLSIIVPKFYDYTTQSNDNTLSIGIPEIINVELVRVINYLNLNVNDNTLSIGIPEIINVELVRVINYLNLNVNDNENSIFTNTPEIINVELKEA